MLKIRELRERNNLTQDEMVTKTGISKRSYVDYESGNTDIPFSKLQNIASALNVEISELIPSNKKVEEPQTVYMLRTDSVQDHQKIPLYDIHAAAGLIPLFDSPNKNRTEEFIVIPRAPKCDGAIFITGDSMYPLLKSGDIVVFKKINVDKNEIFWGEMYIISVHAGDEDYISVKYVHKGSDEDHIKLVSQNSHHEPKEIPISKVTAMAIVKASIRINSMS